MIKKIKKGKNIGVAEPVQGLIVDVSKYSKNMYRFTVGNNIWIASDYAFEEDLEK